MEYEYVLVGGTIILLITRFIMGRFRPNKWRARGRKQKPLTPVVTSATVMTPEEREKKRIEKLKKYSLWTTPIIALAVVLVLVARLFPSAWEWLLATKVIVLIFLVTGAIWVTKYSQGYLGAVGIALIWLIVILATIDRGRVVWPQVRSAVVAGKKIPPVVNEVRVMTAYPVDDWYNCDTYYIDPGARSLRWSVSGPVRMRTVVQPPYESEEFDYYPGQKTVLTKYPARAFKAQSKHPEKKEVRIKFEYVLYPKTGNS